MRSAIRAMAWDSRRGAVHVGSWWWRLRVALRDCVGDGVSFAFLDTELGRVCAPGGNAPDPDSQCGLAVLRRRVDAAVKHRWRRQWRVPDTLFVPGTGFGYTVPSSSGSSWVEVRAWLVRLQPGEVAPLMVDGRCTAFQLRVQALGGVGALVHNRNLRLLREQMLCVVCGQAGSSNSLVHLIGECRVFAATRARAWRAVGQIASDDAAGDLHLVRVADAAIAGRPAAVSAMVCLSLGVPVVGSYGDGPAPWWRRLWYPRPPVGSRERSETFRGAVLRRTAALVVDACRRLQQAAWALPGAVLPAREAQRRLQVARTSGGGGGDPSGAPVP